jgi:hypothetical protein
LGFAPTQAARRRVSRADIGGAHAIPASGVAPPRECRRSATTGESRSCKTC